MKGYTITEVNQMIQMRKEGASYQEIAEMFGRSKFAVQKKLSQMGACVKQPEQLLRGKAKKAAAEKAMTVPPISDKPAPVVKSEMTQVSNAPVRKAMLSDFSPREIIKYLYNLGYRIEDNQIVFYQRQVVNIKSVLEEG